MVILPKLHLETRVIHKVKLMTKLKYLKWMNWIDGTIFQYDLLVQYELLVRLYCCHQMTTLERC